MRLLYLTRGHSIHDLRFLQAFGAQGLRVGLVSLSRAERGGRDNGLPQGIHDFGSLDLDSAPSTDNLLSAVPKLRQTIAEFLPDIVLAGPIHDGAFLMVKAAPELCWVAQSWAFDVMWEVEQDADALKRARVTLQTCPALLADAQAVVRKCESIAGRHITRLFLLPWGIDLANTAPAKERSVVRAELGVRNQTVFLCTRKLEPLYRIEILLESFRRFRATGRDAVLLLASEGSLRSSVTAWIKANDLGDSVKLLGMVAQKRLLELFTAVDVYVSPAASDGTSIALLEAMYLGVLPIVSDIGGNPEWVQHGVNGWLAKSDDPEDFNSALIQAFETTAPRRLEICRWNRDLIRSRADWVLNFSRLVHDLAKFSERWGGSA